MTNEEALKFAKEQTYIFGGTMKEFLQFVIDKLERPQGEWKYHGLSKYCSKSTPRTELLPELWC